MDSDFGRCASAQKKGKSFNHAAVAKLHFSYLSLSHNQFSRESSPAVSARFTPCRLIDSAKVASSLV